MGSPLRRRIEQSGVRVKRALRVSSWRIGARIVLRCADKLGGGREGWKTCGGYEDREEMVERK